MTNKEAIDRLSIMQGRCENGYDEEALDLAINALVERPTGEWKQYKDSWYSGGGYTKCSHCKMRYSFGGYNEVFEFKYCPECGAKMKKGEEE